MNILYRYCFIHTHNKNGKMGKAALLIMTLQNIYIYLAKYIISTGYPGSRCLHHCFIHF